MDDLNMHYVSTLDEARELVEKHEKYWVSNCGCREPKGECKQSRMDVCLYFIDYMEPTGSGFHEVDRVFVDGIFAEAIDKHLVPRPFRDIDQQTKKILPVTAGICFCCNCCCGYLTSPGAKDSCDKGKFIENTDLDSCSNCEACTEVCYFGARKMEDNDLVVIKENCFGCGVCVEVCPTLCIKMNRR